MSGQDEFAVFCRSVFAAATAVSCMGADFEYLVRFARKAASADLQTEIDSILKQVVATETVNWSALVEWVQRDLLARGSSAPP